MKKIVVKLAIVDEKAKRRALKLVAGIQGVDSVAVDMKENKITIIGDADPVYLTAKLRKLGSTELLTVGPAKEEKKDEKKDEKKEEKKPQADAKKDNKPQVPTVVYVQSSYDHNPWPYEYSVVHEESSNACTIM